MRINKNKKFAIIYSTEAGTLKGAGRMCLARESVNKRVCRQSQGEGVVRIGRETKGRKGKGVTIITGLLLDYDKMTELAKNLKQKCGTGGTVKKGTIELQGDHRDMLVEELKKQGYAAKRSGG